LQLFGSLLIQCDKADCAEVMELKHFMAHITSSCQHTMVPHPSTVSVDQLLHKKARSHSWYPTLWVLLLRKWFQAMGM